MCPKRVSVREEGEGHIPCRGTNDRKDAGTNSRESGMRNLVNTFFRHFLQGFITFSFDTA